MLFIRLSLAFLALACFACAQDLTYVPIYKNPIHEFINTEYAGAVTVGNKNFILVFDTSSTNTILLSASCIAGACECPALQRYDHNKPNSKETTSVRYFDTAVAKGNSVVDTIQIVNLTAPDEQILLADEVGIELCLLGADGVIGVGPLDSKTVFNSQTVFGSFVDQKLIAPVFSIHHARYENGEHFGEIIFGGYDERYIVGEITYAPIAEPGTWKFKLDGITINGKNFVKENTLALVDSSKYIVVGPRAEIEEINKEIGCNPVKKATQEICEVDCNKIDSLPDVNFVISGRNFNISAEYYVQVAGEICYTGFSPCDKLDHVLLGDYFVDNVYSIFDGGNKKMGFAVAKEEL